MKYVLLVHGPMAENEAERAAGMAEMADWYGTLGTALVESIHRGRQDRQPGGGALKAS
jgi:hypothetical protein